MNSLAHIEINVSNLERSKDFYLMVLAPLGWELTIDNDEFAGFKGEDNTHLFLVQTDESYVSNGFHRKQVGLNHLAFRVESKQAVDEFADLLRNNYIETLYTEGPKDYCQEYHMEHYYAVFFEDPDRIKLEVVFMK
jgi:catechol 2,3-dioxygenase-like lactoylglutathione lyase family enzyme